MTSAPHSPSSGSMAGWPGRMRFSSSRPTCSASPSAAAPRPSRPPWARRSLAGLGAGLWSDRAAAVRLLESGCHTFTPARELRLAVQGHGALAQGRRDRDRPLPQGASSR